MTIKVYPTIEAARMADNKGATAIHISSLGSSLFVRSYGAEASKYSETRKFVDLKGNKWVQHELGGGGSVSPSYIFHADTIEEAEAQRDVYFESNPEKRQAGVTAIVARHDEADHLITTWDSKTWMDMKPIHKPDESESVKYCMDDTGVWVHSEEILIGYHFIQDTTGECIEAVEAYFAAHVDEKVLGLRVMMATHDNTQRCIATWDGLKWVEDRPFGGIAGTNYAMNHVGEWVAI